MEDINLKLNIDESAVKKALPSLKELRKELKAIQDQMAGMEEGSDEFLAAANKAGTLKHQIDEIRQATAGASADFGDMLGNVTKAAAGLTGAFQVVQGSLSLLGVESESVTESIKTMQSMMAITQGLASIDNGIKALDKLRNAITGTTVVAKALRAALTPKAILAVTAAITAAVAIFKHFRKEEEEQQKALEKQKEEARETAELYNKTYAASINNVMTSYKKLQNEYKNLSSVADKQKWIEKNKTELNGLGLSINNVNDAEDTFVTNSANVIKAFELRAQAAATQKLAEKEYEKYYLQQAEYSKMYTDLMVSANEEVVQSKVGSFKMLLNYYATDAQGIKKWTEEGAAAFNKYLNDVANLASDLANNDPSRVYLHSGDRLMQMSAEMQQRAEELSGTAKRSNAEQVKSEEDVIAKLKEKYDQQVALLNLDRDNGNPDAQGQDYYKRMIEIQNEYKNEMSLTGKATAQDFLEIDQAIMKTTLDSQALYEQEEEARKQREQDAFDNSMSGIDTNIAAANAAFAESSLAENDEITRLQTILNLERQRLELMSLAGLEGTQAWYELKQAVAEYENELKNAKEGNDTLKKTMSNVSKVGTAAMGAIGNVLTDLAATQDQTSREGFETAKKLNIAAATMSMLTGLVEIWAGTFTTKTGPWDYGLMAIQSAALIATSAININNIKKQTFDSAGSTSTSASGISNSAVAASITPPVLSVLEVQGAEIIGAIADQKVYVSEVDLQRINKKVTVQEAENTY